MISATGFTEPKEAGFLYDGPRSAGLVLRPGVVRTIIRAGRAFRSGGLDAAAPFIARPVPDDETAPRERAEATAWVVKVASQLVFGRQLCLFESVTVCAGMRHLRYPVEIAVGHAMGTSITSSPVHAWIAIDDVPLLDFEGPEFHFEIARYPRDLVV